MTQPPSVTHPVHWDPQQYLKFTDHRLRPALDLLQQIKLEQPTRIHDLGCGTGHIAALLAQRWPEAQVQGVDSSQAMLDEAAEKHPELNWLNADISQWQPEQPADLLYSNAALHWLDDHPQLFPGLMQQLRSGGVLAVQMPCNWSAPSHQLIGETLDTLGFALNDDHSRNRLDHKPVLEAADYHDLLAGLSNSIDIWETEYQHSLNGEHAVLEWVKGAALRPVLQALDAEQQTAFLEHYAMRLREVYPHRSSGATLYPFKRLFIVAVAR